MTIVHGIVRKGKTLTLCGESIRNLAAHYEEDGNLHYFIALYNEITKQAATPKKSRKGGKGKGKSATDPARIFSTVTYKGKPVNVGTTADATSEGFDYEEGLITITDTDKFPGELLAFLQRQQACDPVEYAQDFCKHLLRIEGGLSGHEVLVKVLVEYTAKVSAFGVSKTSVTDVVKGAFTPHALVGEIPCDDEFDSSLLRVSEDAGLDGFEIVSSETQVTGVKIE